jgi:hypothetical protein
MQLEDKYKIIDDKNVTVARSTRTIGNSQGRGERQNPHIVADGRIMDTVGRKLPVDVARRQASTLTSDLNVILTMVIEREISQERNGLALAAPAA